MASRLRLGVALVLDPPVGDEVQGLRRALGDPSIDRIPPHLTLVPPVNVRAADLGAALEVLRSAAARQPGPLRLTLGPPATFVPDNPVLFLDVGGDIERLRELRGGVFRPPLERTLSWPWVPHFTLADGIDEDRIESALASLGSYVTVADFDRIVMLEEGRGRLWNPIADVVLGPAAMVGTGGLALRITRGRIIDPLAVQVMDNEEECRRIRLLLAEQTAAGHGTTGAWPIVLTAHRGGQLLGTGAVWNGPSGPRAMVFVVPEARGEGTGGHLLAQLESAALDAGLEHPLIVGEGPAGFYESRSAWIRAVQDSDGPPTAAPADSTRLSSSAESPTRTRQRRTGRAS